MGTCIKARSNTRNISTQSIAALVCTTCFLRLATQLHRVARFWMKPNVWSLLCATMLQFEISAQVVSIPITSSIENLIRNFSVRQIDELRQFATTHVLGGWMTFLFPFLLFVLSRMPCFSWGISFRRSWAKLLKTPKVHQPRLIVYASACRPSQIPREIQCRIYGTWFMENAAALSFRLLWKW